MYYVLFAFFTLFAYIRNVDERIVSYGLYGFTLIFGTAMYIGGDL